MALLFWWVARRAPDQSCASAAVRFFLLFGDPPPFQINRVGERNDG